MFARLPVLPALGETEAAWARHRDAVVADLAPNGPVERALAERVAQLHWRLARAVRFDAAYAATLAPAAAAVDPPDPAFAKRYPGPELESETIRHNQAEARTAAARCAAARAALTDELPGDAPVDAAVARRVWHAACQAAGFDPVHRAWGLVREFLPTPTVTGPAPDTAWLREATRKQFPGLSVCPIGPGEEAWYVGWSAGRVRQGVAFLARKAGTDPATLTAATTDVLAEARRGYQQTARSCGRELGRRAGAAQAQRAAKVLGAAGGDPARLLLTVQYERALSRELERTLQLLGDRQAERASDECD